MFLSLCVILVVLFLDFFGAFCIQSIFLKIACIVHRIDTVFSFLDETDLNMLKKRSVKSEIIDNFNSYLYNNKLHLN